MTTNSIHDHATAPNENGSPSIGEPSLPTARIDEIREQIAKHVDDNRRTVTRAKVATRAGISEATLSLFLAHKYTGNNSAVALKLDSYLDRWAEQKAITDDVPFVLTSASRQMLGAIEEAEATRSIALITAVAGCGKTRVLHEHRQRNSGSLLITACSDITSPRAIVDELLMKLSKKAIRTKQSTSDARRDVVARLTGTDRTILIDEAQHLPKSVIETLRLIAHDMARVGLVLAGNTSLYERGTGQLLRDTSATSYTQFARRVIARVDIDVTTFGDDDVRVVAQCLAPAPIIDAALHHLVAEARENGGFGRVVRILQKAQKYAGNRPLTHAHVLKALDNVMSWQTGGVR